MALDRRHFLTFTAAGAASVSDPFSTQRAFAAPLSVLGVDALHFGVRAGSPDDQTAALQNAIDQAAGARVALVLGPGVYRTGHLRLSAGAQIVGVRGATRLVLTQGPSLLSAYKADSIGLTGLILDGVGVALPEGRGLVHFSSGNRMRIADCEILDAGRHGVALESTQGEITGTTIVGATAAAIHSRDARGLTIAGNTIRQSGDNGIQVWRSTAGDDGTLVLDNRIEETRARSGGSGQNGNAINVFRAANVMVRGNRIAAAAFSAIRGNAASNLQIIGNSCSRLGEVALYAEFGFEGAVIANNIVDGAAIGVSVTNFNEGGRLAVVQGNLIRNLTGQRPAGTDPKDVAGIGIGVEADAAITGNVIEFAPLAGIYLGWGPYLRDIAVSTNTVRNSGIGIAVSVAPGAGSALISQNMISGTRHGAIVGMDRKRIATGDLARDGAARFAQLTIAGNRYQ